MKSFFEKIDDAARALARSERIARKPALSDKRGRATSR
jgi:hypothetical protein